MEYRINGETSKTTNPVEVAVWVGSTAKGKMLVLSRGTSDGVGQFDRRLGADTPFRFH